MKYFLLNILLPVLPFMIEELKSKGVEFKKAPTEEFYGVEALFRDDSGNWFSLGQKK